MPGSRVTKTSCRCPRTASCRCPRNSPRARVRPTRVPGAEGPGTGAPPRGWCGLLPALLLGDQSAGVGHQIGQHGKRLGRQEHALVVGRLPVAPETLVDGIEPKGWELLHECLLQGRNGVLRG